MARQAGFGLCAFGKDGFGVVRHGDAGVALRSSALVRLGVVRHGKAGAVRAARFGDTWLASCGVVQLGSVRHGRQGKQARHERRVSEMAFARKKTDAATFSQSNASMLATEALRKNQASIVRVAFRVTGETPLLMNRWSNKAINQMVGKMVGLPVPRGPKDLTGEFENSYYRNLEGQLAMPCRIVKAAIVEGAIATGGVTSKAELKRGLRVLGYTSPIKLKTGTKVEIDCRIAQNNGTPDMRSRAVIPAGYSFDVVLQFPTILTPDKVTAAFQGAGFSIGLCDWRPEKGGDFGAFNIEALQDSEQARILKACSIPEEEYHIPPEFMRPFHGSVLPTSDMTRKAIAVATKVNSDAKANGVAKRKRGSEEAAT